MTVLASQPVGVAHYLTPAGSGIDRTLALCVPFACICLRLALIRRDFLHPRAVPIVNACWQGNFPGLLVAYTWHRHLFLRRNKGIVRSISSAAKVLVGRSLAKLSPELLRRSASPAWLPQWPLRCCCHLTGTLYSWCAMCEVIFSGLTRSEGYLSTKLRPWMYLHHGLAGPALLSPTWKPSTRGLIYVWPRTVRDPDPPVWSGGPAVKSWFRIAISRRSIKAKDAIQLGVEPTATSNSY